MMEAIRAYIDHTKRRITFEWALIEGQNDKPEVARQLGRLVERHGLRKDMVHINLIPLNPTGGYKGSPSGRKSVDEFVRVLEKDFGLTATPRVRRGIDIEVGPIYCFVFLLLFLSCSILIPCLILGGMWSTNSSGSEKRK